LTHPFLEKLRAEALKKSSKSKKSADDRWAKQRAEEAAKTDADAMRRRDVETKRLKEELPQPKSKPKKAKPKPSPESLRAARRHHEVLTAADIRLEGNPVEWVTAAAVYYDKAFNKNQATAREAEEVWDFVAGAGSDFWPDKLLSAEQLFTKRKGVRKFSTVLAQARRQGKPKGGKRNTGTQREIFNDIWKGTENE